MTISVSAVCSSLLERVLNRDPQGDSSQERNGRTLCLPLVVYPASASLAEGLCLARPWELLDHVLHFRGKQLKAKGQREVHPCLLSLTGS